MTAGGNVTASGVSVRNLTTPGVLSAGAAGITPFLPDADANVLHTLSAATVRSIGGIDFSGANFVDRGSAGGMLTINANSLDISSTGDIRGTVNFNGADKTVSQSVGGSGGVFNLLTSGAINVGTRIDATTGLQPQTSPPAGAGGTVNLESTQSSVTVNAPIVVSSADPPTEAATPPPVRRSARGGNISLKSSAASNVAINVTSSGALLSLLDAAAPGPGGKITILATGANQPHQCEWPRAWKFCPAAEHPR